MATGMPAAVSSRAAARHFGFARVGAACRAGRRSRLVARTLRGPPARVARSPTPAARLFRRGARHVTRSSIRRAARGAPARRAAEVAATSPARSTGGLRSSSRLYEQSDGGLADAACTRARRRRGHQIHGLGSPLGRLRRGHDERGVWPDHAGYDDVALEASCATIGGGGGVLCGRG